MCTCNCNKYFFNFPSSEVYNLLILTIKMLTLQVSDLHTLVIFLFLTLFFFFLLFFLIFLFTFLIFTSLLIFLHSYISIQEKSFQWIMKISRKNYWFTRFDVDYKYKYFNYLYVVESPFLQISLFVANINIYVFGRNTTKTTLINHIHVPVSKHYWRSLLSFGNTNYTERLKCLILKLPLSSETYGQYCVFLLIQ